jgi:hypothetical protein
VDDLRDPGRFAVAVLLGYAVFRFLAVGAHEMLGHGLAATLAGGTLYGVYVSPGSGFALLAYPAATPPAAVAAALLAGTFAELVLGLVLLFLLYPRMAADASRFLVLLAAQVFLVHGALSFAVGSIPVSSADPVQAALVLDAPWLLAATFLGGLALAVLFVAILTRELLKIPGMRPPRQPNLFLALFWLLPLGVAALAGLVATLASLALPDPLLSAGVVLFLLLYTAVGAFAIFFPARSAASRAPPSPVAETRGAPAKVLSTLVVAALILLPAWLLPFGPTVLTAHGLLLAPPPLEAERQWASPLAINVRVRVAADGLLLVEFRFKGVPPLVSPLERQVWATFEDRADFPYYASLALAYAAAMFPGTSWSVLDRRIEGSVWVANETATGARLVVVGPAEGASPLRVEDRTYVLAFVDPLRAAPSPQGFLDVVNVTWGSGLTRVSAEASGGTTVPQVGPRFVAWFHLDAEAAHARYEITLALA